MVVPLWQAGGMSSPPTHGPADGKVGTTLRDVEALAQGVVSTLQVSRALLTADRRICLSGLEAQVEEICRGAALLHAHERSAMRLCLLGLRSEIDMVTTLIQAQEAGGACPSMTS